MNEKQETTNLLEEVPTLVKNNEENLEDVPLENNKNEEKCVTDDEDEYDTEDEEDECSNYDFMLVEDSEIYLLTKNDKPLFYIRNRKEAFEHMWRLARCNKNYYSDSYRTFIKEEMDVKILSVIGYYKFSVLSYEKLLNKFEIVNVKELDMNETKNDNENVKRGWW